MRVENASLNAHDNTLPLCWVYDEMSEEISSDEVVYTLMVADSGGSSQCYHRPRKSLRGEMLCTSYVCATMSVHCATVSSSDTSSRPSS